MSVMYMPMTLRLRLLIFTRLTFAQLLELIANARRDCDRRFIISHYAHARSFDILARNAQPSCFTRSNPPQILNNRRRETSVRTPRACRHNRTRSTRGNVNIYANIYIYIYIFIYMHRRHMYTYTRCLVNAYVMVAYIS